VGYTGNKMTERTVVGSITATAASTMSLVPEDELKSSRPNIPDEVYTVMFHQDVSSGVTEM
jgi:hypothetical protein